MKDFRFVLPNGITVVFRPFRHTRVVHCGIIVDVGTKDELPGEEGMAHFIEHMVFKGTRKRKNFHILNYLESVGGDLNAYTTKEKTCFYASLATVHFPRAIELLSDIVFGSVFPAEEIRKEKHVIGEEIDMYRDSPEEAIFEDFDLLCYPQHALGKPILGTKESLKGFNRTAIRRFMQRTYTGARIICSITGDLSEQQVREVCTRLLGEVEVPQGKRRKGRKPAFSTFREVVKHPQQQVHEVIGAEAYSLYGHKNYIPFYLLNNHLGGPSMNSLLNYRIREKYGLTYNIYSFFSPYEETGVWGLYFACDPGSRERIEELVHKELKLLRKEKPGTTRLSQMKKQMTGQLTLSFESPLSQMLGMAKNYLDFGKDWTLEEFVKEVEAVTASQVLESANHVFAPRGLSTLLYLPEE